MQLLRIIWLSSAVATPLPAVQLSSVGHCGAEYPISVPKTVLNHLSDREHPTTLQTVSLGCICIQNIETKTGLLAPLSVSLVLKRRKRGTGPAAAAAGL